MENSLKSQLKMHKFITASEFKAERMWFCTNSEVMTNSKPIFVEFKNTWDAKLFLASAEAKWDPMEKNRIYIWRTISRDEILKENAYLKKRSELLNSEVARKNLKNGNFSLYNGIAIINIKELKWLTVTSGIVLDVKNLLSFEKKMLFSNAVTLKNYHFLCIKETFLILDVATGNLLLRNCQFFWSDKNSNSMPTSHAGVLLALRKQLTWGQIEFEFTFFATLLNQAHGGGRLNISTFCSNYSEKKIKSTFINVCGNLNCRKILQISQFNENEFEQVVLD